jgi:hypothetical protein
VTDSEESSHCRLLPHQIRKTWVADRKGECARCGIVNIKSGGSDRHGGVRWRCANQVNEYRRRRRRAKADVEYGHAPAEYGFPLVRPCCATRELIEPPNRVSSTGDAFDQYYDHCPVCGRTRILHVTWVFDSDGTLNSVVSFVDVEQVYADGVHVRTTIAGNEVQRVDCG